MRLVLENDEKYIGNREALLMLMNQLYFHDYDVFFLFFNLPNLFLSCSFDLCLMGSSF